MKHVLDNPAWNALITGNEHLSLGSKEVKFFNENTSPFAGFSIYTEANFQQLHELYNRQNPQVIILDNEITVPKPWMVLRYMICLQMVFKNAGQIAYDEDLIVPLASEHVPQMLALTALTNPGPFTVNTIAFGHYYGVFDNGTLVAMAGQRLNPVPYAEISAVCTHPDYIGRGYARQLLLHQANRIQEAGGVPFLHVREDNERAIKVYKSLGFETRAELHFYVIHK